MKSFKEGSMEKKYKLYFLILLSILSKILVIFIPYCLEKMIDSAVSKAVTTFNYYGMLMCILTVTNILLQAEYSFQLDTAQEESILEMKEKMILHVSNRPLNEFRNNNISYYYQRFTNDAEECRFLFYEKRITEICNVIFLILLLITMFRMSFELSLIIVLLTLVFLALKKIMLPIIEKRQKKMIQSDENLNSFFEEYVSGQETIRNYKKYPTFFERFCGRKISLFRKYKENTLIETVYDIVLMTSILNAADILINWIGGYHIILGKMTVGMLTAYTVYFYRLWDIANAIMSMPKKSIKAKVSLDRIEELIDSDNQEITNALSIPLPAIKVIRFQNMSYSIASRVIFSDYSSSIVFDPGGITGIIGPNGSGKSTLAQLINKNIVPTSGYIYYNDINYQDIPEQDIKNNILVVPAESYIFEGSTKDNILFFSKGELSDRIQRLLYAVGLSENDYLKQNGSNISNGQKKIIEMCRSFISSQKAIIYDEPTNFVDERIKKIIIYSIKEIAQYKMIIVITHDTELIQACTSILNLTGIKDR